MPHRFIGHIVAAIILAPWLLLWGIAELVLHAFNIPHPHIR